MSKMSEDEVENSINNFDKKEEIEEGYEPF